MINRGGELVNIKKSSHHKISPEIKQGRGVVAPSQDGQKKFQEAQRRHQTAHLCRFLHLHAMAGALSPHLAITTWCHHEPLGVTSMHVSLKCFQ